MEEILLTESEVEAVIEEVERSPWFKDQNILNMGKSHTTIYKVSPNNELIFIKGNIHTGFTHINERHSYWTQTFFWIQKDKKIKLDDPSRFNKSFLPIIDYVRIADDLYTEVNRDTKNNKRPNEFDLFTGRVIDGEDENEYRLLLYKGTKVVHTLFPLKRKYNRKKHLDLVRGNVDAKHFLDDDVFVISIPYRDHKDRVHMSFQVLTNDKQMTEQGIIINHKVQKQVTVFKEKLKSTIEPDDKVRYYQHADLTPVERIMKQLLKDEDNF